MQTNSGINLSTNLRQITQRECRKVTNEFAGEKCCNDTFVRKTLPNQRSICLLAAANPLRPLQLLINGLSKITAILFAVIRIWNWNRKTSERHTVRCGDNLMTMWIALVRVELKRLAKSFRWTRGSRHKYYIESLHLLRILLERSSDFSSVNAARLEIEFVEIIR